MHITAHFPCMLCGVSMRVKKQFQKHYIKHMKEAHNDLSPEEMEQMEAKIRKLKYQDICDDLPPELRTVNKPKSASCRLCGLNFSHSRQLDSHILMAHPESDLAAQVKPENFMIEST
jgi:hypothetical protein